MRNIGETPRFEISGGPGTLAYVWKWWDNTVDAVTGTNRVYKQLNVGGDPLDSFLVRYSCEVVDDVGQSIEAFGTLVVNNPPFIPGTIPPAISRNDEIFPFGTQFSIRTCDFEEAGIPFVSWYDNTAHLGDGDIDVPLAHPVAGTYGGRFCGHFTPYLLTLDYTVTQDGTVSAYIIDGNAGTTQVDFLVRGYTPDDPFVLPAVQSTSLIVDASSLPRQVISPGAVIELGAYSGISADQPVFTWSFNPVNGWAQAERVYWVVPQQQSNGAWSGTCTKDVSGETAGDKVVDLTIAVGGVSSSSQVPVTLVDNEPPEDLDVTIQEAGEDIPTDNTVTAGAKLSYFVSATDPNLEITYAKWTMVLDTTTYYFMGNKIFIDTTGLSGKSITGVVTVYDTHDSSTSLDVPTVYVS